MDRQEDRIAISILRISVLTCDKNDNSLRLETQTNVHATTTTLSCHHNVARRRATTTRHGVVPPRRHCRDSFVVVWRQWNGHYSTHSLQQTWQGSPSPSCKFLSPWFRPTTTSSQDITSCCSSRLPPRLFLPIIINSSSSRHISHHSWDNETQVLEIYIISPPLFVSLDGVCVPMTQCIKSGLIN